MDERLQRIQQWLEQDLGHTGFSLTPASADASFRRYFRVRFTDKTATKIVMDAPPDKEDSRPFIKLARQFLAIGLNVPEIYAENFTEGFFLLSDLGHAHYLSQLDNDSVDSLYEQAMYALLKLQTDGPVDVPAYDATLLNSEMQLFVDWYLLRHLQCELNTADKKILAHAFSVLTESALQQPKVCVHRDYHSRNLMMPLSKTYANTSLNPAMSGQPGIIDFQDAVYGPISYDLVSLLRDCYIDWPTSLVYSKVAWYFQQAQQRQLLSGITQETFVRWFDLMGIQRHLKATGIFARLNYRDGKPGYLDDIPRTLSYICTVAPKYPELTAFSQLLDRLIPEHASTG